MKSNENKAATTRERSQSSKQQGIGRQKQGATQWEAGKDLKSSHKKSKC